MGWFSLKLWEVLCTISTRDSLLPPILNSPEWLISPDCHQKWGSSPSPLLMLMHGHHSILNCGKDSLWARCSAGVQGAGSLAGVAPLPKKIVYLVGMRYMQFHYPFSWVGGEHRIKYFQIILNSNFSLLSCQNWNYSKSCQLATFELPIGNFSVKNLNLISQIQQILIKVANWQLKSRQLATFYFLSNFNFG